MHLKNDPYRDLLLRCAKEDKQAFQELYTSLSPTLFAVALNLLRQKGLAEDILQESFLKIWKSAALFMPHRGTAKTWMITVTRNKALDRLRALKSRPHEVESEYEGLEFASASLEPDGFAAQNEEVSQLMLCISQMKPEQRECLLLCYYYGYTHSELAHKMNKPLGTIKAWLRRGQEKVREAAGYE